jgi:hypothetical protein
MIRLEAAIMVCLVILVVFGAIKGFRAIDAGIERAAREAEQAREQREQANERKAAAIWNGPCADESVLLATTAGSPSGFRCPNRLHRMEVQVATTPSKEEAAALVFCRCERERAP